MIWGTSCLVKVKLGMWWWDAVSESLHDGGVAIWILLAAILIPLMQPSCAKKTAEPKKSVEAKGMNAAGGGNKSQRSVKSKSIKSGSGRSSGKWSLETHNFRDFKPPRSSSWQKAENHPRHAMPAENTKEGRIANQTVTKNRFDPNYATHTGTDTLKILPHDPIPLQRENDIVTSSSGQELKKDDADVAGSGPTWEEDAGMMQRKRTGGKQLNPVSGA